jgi:hypothetical protein
MRDAILSLGLVLSGILLACTTYAALWGVAGAFTRRSYERCPDCHRHYLADKNGPRMHQCNARWEERLQHALHFPGHGHHAHAGRG